MRGTRGKKKVEIAPSEQYLQLASKNKPINIGKDNFGMDLLLKDFSDDLLKKVPPEYLSQIDKKRVNSLYSQKKSHPQLQVGKKSTTELVEAGSRGSQNRPTSSKIR